MALQTGRTPSIYQDTDSGPSARWSSTRSTNGGFRRLYLMLFISLLLIFLVGLGAAWLINDWRQDSYRQRLASAPMALLTALVASQPADARDQWLSAYEDELGIRLAMSDPETLRLGFLERYRLNNGGVLARRAEGESGWQLYRELPGEDGAVLAAQFVGLSERQPILLVSLLRQWLELAPEAERETRFRSLRQRMAVGMGLGSGTPPGLSERQLASFNDGHVVINIGADRANLSFYASLPGGRWLMVGPLRPFEPLPLMVIAAVMAMLLLLFGMVIYLLLRSLERRLTRLEQITLRFTSGDFGARAEPGQEYLTQLEQSFNTMADQVQSVLSSQQELMRAVSHEFRTPVARVRFALQMVDDMSDSPAIRRLLGGVDDDIEAIDRLIDEILTYARLDNTADGSIPLAPITLAVGDMADEVVKTLTTLFPRLTLEVVGDSALRVHADRRYLQRALQNLVVNACHHAESRVRIQLTGDNQSVYISVEDDGPGVPEQSRRRIFKPFARLDDSRTRQRERNGGYGLGLAIVARVMEWHDGHVEVDSAPELGGARFILCLPREWSDDDEVS
ncbi:ATP-binding protein [Kushneria aurantia]|uniref:histidine kinase n=1 Tax=Kushneria aurantia TaxID=504092 RepID=A0ABV6G0W2_9GAMM|nr:ATP-binding protein [Kushneria aurantia]